MNFQPLLSVLILCTATFLAPVFGCSPGSGNAETKSGGWGESGGENLTTGRYDWIRFTFQGGDYVAGDYGEVPSVATGLTRDLPTLDEIPKGTSFHASASQTFDSQQTRRRFLLDVAEAFLGLNVRVTSDVGGDDVFLSEQLGRQYAESYVWNRARDGLRSVEVVMTGVLCAQDNTCREMASFEWGLKKSGEKIRGRGTFRPYKSGEGSPVVFVNDINKGTTRVRATLHEIGHGIGMRHTASGVMAKIDYPDRLWFSLFQAREVNDGGWENGTVYRPIDKLGPAFGFRGDSALRSFIGDTEEVSVIVVNHSKGPQPALPAPVFPGATKVVPQSLEFGEESMHFLQLSGARLDSPLIVSRTEFFHTARVLPPVRNRRSPKSLRVEWSEAKSDSGVVGAAVHCQDGYLLAYPCDGQGACKSPFDCRSIAPLSQCFANEVPGALEAVGGCMERTPQ